MKKTLCGLVIFIACVTIGLQIRMAVISDKYEKDTVPAASFSEKNTEQDIIRNFTGKTYYYYNTLNNKQKKAYGLLYDCFINYDVSVIAEMAETEILTVFTAVIYDNPELFWVGYNFDYTRQGEKISFTPNYTMEKSAADAMNAQLNKKIDEILNEADKLKSDYEKELYFHDYICKNTVYDMETFGKDGGTVYSSLINGRAVCEGYAKAMQILLDKAGIYNYLITGMAETDEKPEPHMWNIVRINGKNYHLDATWDDLDTDKEVQHLWFNITDSEISLDHSELLPAENNCFSNDDSFFYRNGTYISSFSGYDDLLIPFADLVNSGQLNIELRFKTTEDYNKALDIVANDDAIFDFIRELSRQCNYKICDDEVEYLYIDEYNYLRIIFKKD